MSILELLGDWRQQNHRETIAMVQAAHMDAQNKESIHTKRRLDAQLDSLLKSKCGDQYQPPCADEMGHTFLNSPIIGDDAVNKLASAVANASTQQTQQTQQPRQEPQPERSSPIASFLKTMLPLLATAGVSIAAARYFMPADTDTRNNFTIRALPYEPPEATP